MKEEIQEDSSLLTLKTASELLGCHPNTLRQWDNNGTLVAVRLGARKDRYYRKADVLRLIGKSSYVKSAQEVTQVSEVRKGYFQEYAGILAQWGRLTSDSVFVDVPCGTGEMVKELVRRGFGRKFYAIDINADMIQAAQASLELVSNAGTFILGDAGDIADLVPEKVDAIFCLNGFHIYLDRKEDFLRGCFAMLKPGGYLIFDVSTKGIRDQISQDFLEAEKGEFARLALEAGTTSQRPLWSNEQSLEAYRSLAMVHGFVVDETISIDKYMTTDEVVQSTIKIPGRLRPWLPGISDEKRMEIFQNAHNYAVKETGITTVKHNRIFFIAKKP